MPTIITHGVVGLLTGKIGKARMKLVLLAIFCSIFPDFDALGFKFNIPYFSTFGHRGFFHSIFFALLFCFILLLLTYWEDRKNTKLTLKCYSVMFLAMLSHSVLDAMTDGGLGVAFFSPFITERYFFSFQFIPVAPIAIKKFFSMWGLRVMVAEIAIIWLPLILTYLIFKIFRKNKTGTNS